MFSDKNHSCLRYVDVVQNYSEFFDRNPRFPIEILGFLFEILGFLFKVLGISKICDNRIPCDSCSNQLVSINHEIYKSFEDDYVVRGVFLDMSKAFDKT